MIMFNMFSEYIASAQARIVSNTNFVLSFEILPDVNLRSAFAHCSVSMCVLLVSELAMYHAIPVTALPTPFVLAPLSLFILGVRWWLAATGVFIRHIGQTIGVLFTALMFLSAIFLPVSSLLLRFRRFVYWSPTTVSVKQNRNVLAWGKPSGWQRWGINASVCRLIKSLRFAWFQESHGGLADVV
jgi:lipopolysaccharide transport system permease protein